MNDNGDLRLRVRLLEHAVRDVDRRLGVVETRLADLLARESNTQTEPAEERDG